MAKDIRPRSWITVTCLSFVLVATLGCETNIGGGDVDGGGGGGGGDEIDAALFEECDGLDNDGDGAVDEDCDCDPGAAQDCYVDSQAPSEGCAWGSQSCGDNGWGDCTGATYPPAGEAICCGVLGDDPEHLFYDDYRAAYPATALPNNIGELNTFLPSLEGNPMQYSLVNPADEFIDRRVGGLTDANINLGLAAVRESAVATIPATGEIVAEIASPVARKTLRGSGTCNGVGWAWGSVLYQTDDLAVGEIVFMYVGFCEYVSETDHPDGEAFYFSEEPVTVCAGPTIM